MGATASGGVTFMRAFMRAFVHDIRMVETERCEQDNTHTHFA